MSTVTNVQSRIAGLAEGEHVISGVAIGIGDITKGLEGDRKYWSRDELQAAASSLEGQDINALHSQQDVGEVTRAGFDPTRGVIYEAELEDSKLADNIARGSFEVSIEAKHADGGTIDTDSGEAMLASNITFTGMAIVQHGAAPSASAQPGEAAALSPADITAALESDGPASTEGDAEDIEISDSVEEGLQTKVDEHNDEAPGSKQVTLGTLKKVFRRGAGAWLNSNAGATQQQWAYARVNAFLEDLIADRPLNDGNDNDLAPDGYGPAEEAASLVDVNGTEIDLTPPEAVVNAAEAALEAKEEYDTLSDCGTGVGDTRGEQIVNGDLAPEDFTSGGQAETAIPDYLNSHSDDVDGLDDPPTQWGEETWTDGCGPVQFALWGGTTTGTGIEWAQSTADQVEAAMEDADEAAVGPVQFDGTAEGDLDESEIPPDDYEGHYLNPGENKTASSFPVVDADGTLRRGNVASAWNMRGQGDLGMPRDAAERVLRSLAEAFGEAGSDDNPLPDDAYGGEEAAGTDDAVSPESGQAEVSTGGEPADGTDAKSHTSESMSNDNDTDLEEEVDKLRARLSEQDDEIEQLETTVEQYEEERADVAQAYAEALAAGDTIFDEDDLVEKFTVAELAERFDTTDEATLADVEPDVQSGGGENTEEATLSEAEEAEAAEHREVIADLAGSDGVYKHERKHRAALVAEITGEDPDTILEQES